jgi:hypothetical protein
VLKVEARLRQGVAAEYSDRLGRLREQCNSEHARADHPKRLLAP